MNIEENNYYLKWPWTAENVRDCALKELKRAWIRGGGLELSVGPCLTVCLSERDSEFPGNRLWGHGISTAQWVHCCGQGWTGPFIWKPQDCTHRTGTFLTHHCTLLKKDWTWKTWSDNLNYNIFNKKTGRLECYNAHWISEVDCNCECQKLVNRYSIHILTACTTNMTGSWH